MAQTTDHATETAEQLPPYLPGQDDQTRETPGEGSEDGDDGTGDPEDDEDPPAEGAARRPGRPRGKSKGKNAKGKNAAPLDGWQQIQAIGQSDPDWSLHMGYLYRWEPKTDTTKGGTQPKYLCLYSQPFDIDVVKREHGSGKYNVKINRTNPHTKVSTTIISIIFEIVDPKFPPNVPEEMWINHPANKQWMWAKGKTHNYGNTPADDAAPPAAAAPAAAEATGPLEIAKFIRDTILASQPKTDKGAADSVVAEILRNVPALMKAQSGMGLAEVVTMLTPFLPVILEFLKPKQDPTVPLLMEQMRNSNERAAKLEERLWEARKEADKPPPAPPSLAEQAKSLGEAFQSMNAFAENIGGGKSKGNPWLDFGAEVLGQIVQSPAVAAIASGLMQPRPAPPPPPQMRPPQPVPQAGLQLAPLPPSTPPATPSGTPPGTPPGTPLGTPLATADAPADATPQQEQPAVMNPMQSFFDALKPALLKHMADGMSGLDFAFWIYDGFGAFKLNMLIAQGPAQILQLIQQHDAQLYQQLAPQWQQFGEFVEDLCTWTPQTPRGGMETEPAPEPEPPPAPPAATKATPRKKA